MIYDTVMVKPRKYPAPLLFSALIGGNAPCFQFGYILGLSNISTQLIKEFFDAVQKKSGKELTEEKQRLLWSLIVSMMPLGACLGSVIAGPLSDKLGRKKTLWLCNLTAIVSAVLMGAGVLEILISSGSPYLLMIGRFFGGFYSGTVLTVTQVYIAEIAPLGLRGSFLTIRQFGVSLGYVTIQIMAHPKILGTLSSSYWFFGVGFLLQSLLVAVCLPFCQPSPRYFLIFAGREDVAHQALRKLRGTIEVDEEIKEMKNERRLELENPKFTVWHLLLSSSLRRPLLLVLFLQLGQQFGGLPMTSMYSHQIFTLTGLSASEASIAVILMFVAEMPESILVTWLMDRKGRRPMLLVGFIGATLGQLVLTLALALDDPVGNISLLHFKNYSATIGLVITQISLKAGPTIIPFFIGTEFFLQGPRSTVASLGVFTNRTSNYIVAISFPHLVALLGNYSFIVNIVACFAAVLVVYFFVPETKKKTFEEISMHFRKKSHVDDSETFGPSTSKLTIANYVTTL